VSWYKQAKSIVVEVNPAITSFPIKQTPQGPRQMGGPQEAASIARIAIQKYYNRIDPDGSDFLSQRYKYYLDSIESDWYDYLTFKLKIMPITNKPGYAEMSNPDTPMHEMNMKYRGGKTGNQIYKTPKDAIAEIPEDQNYGYRGMSWEEWKSIQSSGYIKSNGIYNLGETQVNLTCFGYTPGTALHYATSFAPVQYAAAPARPGVVIAVPRDILKDSTMHKGVPNGELGYEGPLPKDKIVHAWMLVVNKVKEGNIEFIIPWVNGGEKSGWLSSLDPTKARMGSGFGLSTSYAIRQMF
jgi:hypothetical protein